MSRQKIAVHKFSSCDGCQLALLNLGESLLTLSELVEIVHFAEAGPVDETVNVDIALVEGSISTSEDLQRIQKIRANSTLLITIGACATSGGLQALRNMADTGQWIAESMPGQSSLTVLRKAQQSAGMSKSICSYGVVRSASVRF